MSKANNTAAARKNCFSIEPNITIEYLVRPLPLSFSFSGHPAQLHTARRTSNRTAMRAQETHREPPAGMQAHPSAMATHLPDAV